MCGISAFFDPARASDLPERLRQMHAPIPHRGPDGDGFLYVDAQMGAHREPPRDRPLLGLGFRWLQIQDRDPRSNQPMASPDGRAWIVFNGEVYNFHELRRELEADGHRFHTESDTEVVLAAYRAWGSDCFERFNGMWAVVIVDVTQRKLVVSRDRLGIKPLYFRSDGATIQFASEIKQLIATGPEPALDLGALARFLVGSRTLPEAGTCFAGIRAVPPATFAELSLTEPPPPRLQFTPFWQLSDFTCPEPRRAPAYRDAQEKLAELVRSAVALRRVADAPVGSLLSGGIDSSLLTALLRQLAGDDRGAAPCFSLLFERGDADVDESPFVAAMTTHCDLTNHAVGFDSAWIRDNIRAVSRVQEEPLTGLPLLAQYRVYELAAAHGMRVILDGIGADEVMGGYLRHHDILLRDRLRSVQLRRAATELRHLLRDDPTVVDGMFGRVVAAPLLSRLRPRRRAGPDWLNPEAIAGLRSLPNGPPRPLRASEPSALNRALHDDVSSLNLKSVLATTDRNSMAHSIEARVPFLDHRVVEHVFVLPDAYKVGGGWRKRILRDVARPLVAPAVTARRDRIGYATPWRRWVLGDLRDDIRASAASLATRLPELIDASGLDALVRRSDDDPQRNWATLWRLYALDRWLDVWRP